MSDLDTLDVDGEFVEALVRRDLGDQEFMLHRAGVRDLLSVRVGERILEIGCGTGPHLVSFADSVGGAGSVVAVDKSRDVLDLAKERLSVAGTTTARYPNLVAGGVTLGRFDLRELPNLGLFDAVLADRLLGHLPEPESALAEFGHRVVRGGRVLVVNLLNAATTVNLGPGTKQRELCDAVLSWRAANGTAGAWVTSVLPSIGRKVGLEPVDARCWAFSCRSLEDTEAHSPLRNYGRNCAAAGFISEKEAIEWANLLGQRDADGTFAATFVVRADLFVKP